VQHDRSGVRGRAIHHSLSHARGIPKRLTGDARTVERFTPAGGSVASNFSVDSNFCGWAAVSLPFLYRWAQLEKKLMVSRCCAVRYSAMATHGRPG
jgi:hypothetical protein